MADFIGTALPISDQGLNRVTEVPGTGADQLIAALSVAVSAKAARA